MIKIISTKCLPLIQIETLNKRKTPSSSQCMLNGNVCMLYGSLISILNESLSFFFFPRSDSYLRSSNTNMQAQRHIFYSWKHSSVQHKYYLSLYLYRFFYVFPLFSLRQIIRISSVPVCFIYIWNISLFKQFIRIFLMIFFCENLSRTKCLSVYVHQLCTKHVPYAPIRLYLYFKQYTTITLKLYLWRYDNQ